MGPYTTSLNGSPTVACRVALSNRARKSSWTLSCTITVPREVHRCPAVPKPENSAASTARSSSALGVTTIGFLPPSSRQADCRYRPVSSPIRDPTALDPVNPTLSTTPSSSARSSPAKVDSPSASTRFRTPSGSPPPCTSRSNSAAPQARDEIPRRHRDREVAGGDDAHHANRVTEREQLLVRHFARHRLAIQPA